MVAKEVTEGRNVTVDRVVLYDPSIVKSGGAAVWDNAHGKEMIPKGCVPTQEELERCCENSQIFANNINVSLNSQWTGFNGNSLVFGECASGKTRYFLMPNVLQANGSYVVTDPAGSIMASCAGFLLTKGYKIRCLNLKDMKNSCGFNPFAYIEDASDVELAAKCILDNMEKKTINDNDDAINKAIFTFLCAIIGYVHEVLPAEQQNFESILDLIILSRIGMDNGSEESVFDRHFSDLKKADPESYAVSKYSDFKKYSAEVALNSIIAVNSFLSEWFKNADFMDLSRADGMDFDKLSDEKTIVFVSFPQRRHAFSWFTAMFFALLLKRLHDPKHSKFGDSTKLTVRCLIDEARNIGKIPNLSEMLKANQKHPLSLTLIFQSYSQMAAVYGDKGAYDIYTSCATKLVLGNVDERTTHIFTDEYGDEFKKDLLSSDKKHCLVCLPEVGPVKAVRYNLDKHPYYRYLAENNPDMKYIPDFKAGEIECERKQGRPVMSNLKKKLHLSLTVTPMVRDQLDAIAAYNNTSVSDLIDVWVEKEYRKMQREKKKAIS